MNILYLCADPGIPIRGTKGAAIHVRAMIDAFAEMGHGIKLITPRAGPEEGNAPSARIVEATPRSASNDREEQAREIARAVQQSATEELGRDRYGMIYERYSLWSDAGAQLAQARGLPLVLEVNAPLVVEASRYRGLKRTDLAEEIERRNFSEARIVTVVSNALREYVIAHGARTECVHVLPNAVNEKFFHPAVDGSAIRTRLGLKEKFVIGFVGTLKPWHDVATLIAAVRQLRTHATRDYHLLLVGDFPDAVRAEITQSLPNAATVVGPIPHDDVPAYIAAMDVAVSPHPSMSDFYFSPLKLFEYLACGIATVAAAVPPIREVGVDGETVWLYPPRDSDALAARLHELASDDAARRRVAWAGAQCVLGEHTWKHNAQKIFEWMAHSLPRERDANQPLLPLFDDKLRAYLFRATRPDLAFPYLRTALARADFEIAQIKILKYKPRRRCVIEYELAAPTERWRVIGKVFKDERGAKQLALYRELSANGFATNSLDGITIPEPLAFIPRMRMLLQECAPGETLEQSVGAADFSARVSQSASAIAKLHSSSIRPSQAYALEDELRQLSQSCAALIARRPERADIFSRHLDALRTLASELVRAELTPAHRDFYYSQVLFADRRVTLMDLDVIALADPALDVGNFIAHLRFLALQKLENAHAFDGAAKLFLDEYARQRRDARSREFLSRLAFYEKATCFRLMRVVLERPHLLNYFDSLYALTNETLGAAAQSVPIYS